MALTEVSSNKSFGGFQKVYSHESKVLGCVMKFGIYIPPQAEDKNNFIEKAGAQKYASEHGIIIVNPDTSPRGLNIPGDSDSWDFGVGAGFYLNATQELWKNNYKMYDYISKEVLDLVNSNFNADPTKQSITGHSMGGHGALILALKNPGLFKSVSAFAPICNPIVCPWGIKAFTGYLGPKETGNWEDWDATELVKKYNGPPLELFIDQGTSDQFLSQLNPDNLVEVCKTSGVRVIYKQRDGYNHSYFFIASFIGEHIEYHAKYLK